MAASPLQPAGKRTFLFPFSTGQLLFTLENPPPCALAAHSPLRGQEKGTHTT